MPDAARTLYLVCYDIASPKRLYRVHKFLIGYKVGGQKRINSALKTKGLRQNLQPVVRALAMYWGGLDMLRSTPKKEQKTIPAKPEPNR